MVCLLSLFVVFGNLIKKYRININKRYRRREFISSYVDNSLLRNLSIDSKWEKEEDEKEQVLWNNYVNMTGDSFCKDIEENTIGTELDSKDIDKNPCNSGLNPKNKEDIDKDTCDTELDMDFENMENIYIDDDGNITDSGKNLKVLKKKWIFEETDDSIEFQGILDITNKVIFCDPPKELLDLLN